MTEPVTKPSSSRGEIVEQTIEDRELPQTGRTTAGSQSRPNHVYALGRIEPRFPTLAVEKEWAQVIGRADAAGLTDRAAIREFLAERENRYLVRELCWVFTVEGLETYILRPRDPADFDLFVEALRPADRMIDSDVDVVIGTLGAIAPPEACNGLALPVCHVDQLYSFDADTLINSIPHPDTHVDNFEQVARDLFVHIAQLADNAGATDEHRALNYLSVRYPTIYHNTAERLAENAALSGVEVTSSRLSSSRRIVDVVFSYTNRRTDVVERYFVRVDVTEKYPFLASKLSPYVSR